MPTALFICGAPGTGKSSSLATITKQARLSSYVLIDPDQIQAPREHVSQLAQESVLSHIQSRRNFVYVASCAHGFVRDAIEMMHAKGYRICIALVYASLPTALERVAERTQQPVPKEVVQQRFQYVSSRAKKFMEYAIDELYLYSNQTNLTLLFSRSKEKESCHVPGTEFYFKYC
jgi:predicted ABC-type ATPase